VNGRPPHRLASVGHLLSPPADGIAHCHAVLGCAVRSCWIASPGLVRRPPQPHAPPLSPVLNAPGSSERLQSPKVRKSTDSMIPSWTSPARLRRAEPGRAPCCECGRPSGARECHTGCDSRDQFGAGGPAAADSAAPREERFHAASGLPPPGISLSRPPPKFATGVSAEGAFRASLAGPWRPAIMRENRAPTFSVAALNLSGNCLYSRCDL